MKITVNIDGKSFNFEIEDLYQRSVIAKVEGEHFEGWPEGKETFKVKQTLRNESTAQIKKIGYHTQGLWLASYLHQSLDGLCL